jgi:hypothetical protein
MAAPESGDPLLDLDAFAKELAMLDLDELKGVTPPLPHNANIPLESHARVSARADEIDVVSGPLESPAERRPPIGFIVVMVLAGIVIAALLLHNRLVLLIR